MCKMITSVYCVDQRAANILYRSPDSKYFRLCRSWKLCLNYSALWLKHKSSHRWHVNSERGCVLLCCSVAKLCLTLCDSINCNMSGLLILHRLRELTQTHVHWVGGASNHLIFCHPLLLPSIFPSIEVFSNESVLCIMWLKYWSFCFSISPSSEYSGLISFRIDWFDFLTVRGTLKSLLQHHSSKASFLRCSALFIVQLSHPYMTIGKTIDRPLSAR